MGPSPNEKPPGRRIPDFSGMSIEARPPQVLGGSPVSIAKEHTSSGRVPTSADGEFEVLFRLYGQPEAQLSRCRGSMKRLDAYNLS